MDSQTEAPPEVHVNFAFLDDEGEDERSRKRVQYHETTFQPETEAAPSQPVVLVREGIKSYNGGKKKVLDDFSMTVERGSIYSLLGSSGCGKTTALKCILGLSFLNEGDVYVFGRNPGSPGSGVPGNRVGYMPQDIALFGIFSIKETLQYYGTLFGMDVKDIKDNSDFLTTFLKLPDMEKRVANLSGGQQRRVSLAVAMIHSPELLILDEPTVGVDPLLREKIWDHLVEIVSTNKTSVIITTHYIEEARQSNMIGMMRGGRLIAEDDPSSLLRRYNAELLEDIVLRMCRKDEQRASLRSRGLEKKISMEMMNTDDMRYANYKSTGVMEDFSKTMEQLDKRTPFMRTFQRMKALTMRNVFTMWRNIILVLFMVLTPSVLVLVICCGIGNDPHSLKFGVVNYESRNLSECENFPLPSSSQLIEENTCDLNYLSCKYLREIDPDKMKMKKYYDEEDALHAVKVGKIWGFLSIPETFSENLYSRFVEGPNADEETLNGSLITYQLDMTNKQISGFLERWLGDAYEGFIKSVLKNCGRNPASGDKPVKGLEPIYGSDDTAFVDFIAPSLLVAYMFFFPLCSSSIQYLNDKRLGTVERARAAGVHTSEIMVSYFFTEGAVMVLQVTFTMGIMAFIFDINVEGNVFLAVLVYLTMGAAGVSGGFLVASVCTQEVEAVLLSMAGFFPNYLLSGVMWPVEGMPGWMQYGTLILPATLPAEAVRSIYSRAWGITHPRVYTGLLTSLGWICGFWALTILLHRFVLKSK